jgi:hypothetical protein
MVEKRYAGQNKTQRDLNALIDEVAALDHGALSGLADDDHPQYAKADDLTAHAAASAEVHGLPENVHVLGNRNAAGEFIQHGSGSASVSSPTSFSPGYKGPFSVTFPVAFSTTPAVFAAGSVAWLVAIMVSGVSTTGFSYRTVSNGNITAKFSYQAIGS